MANVQGLNNVESCNGTSVFTEMPKSFLSKRVSSVSGDDNLMTWGFKQCLKDPYDAEKRPQGIINMGVSENYVMQDMLTEWLSSCEQKWDNTMLAYNDYLGVYTLREALAEFLTEKCHAPEPLDPNQVIIMNGGDTCLEVLGFCLAEPNDAVLCPTPYYGAIKANFGLRAKVNIFPVHLSSKILPGDTVPFQLTVDKLEEALNDAKQKNVNIRALVVVNPHNPLGDMLSKQQVMDMLMFCKRNSLHVIMDEVYMLTVFDKDAEHYSVLRLKTNELPDPQRTHFIYSFSKDFGLSAMRVACIYTWNKDLIKTCSYLSCFQQSAAYIQHLLAKLLRDKDFLDKTYLPTCKQKLYDSHKCVTDTLKNMNIPFVCGSAGLFVWTDFRKFLSANTFKAEMDLLKTFLENSVYITPSAGFYGNEPGWFRIIFSHNILDIERGMDRIKQVCHEISSRQTETNASESVDASLKANIMKAAATKSNDSSLESLLSQLSCQINESDWLEKNTADQWKATNPETYKAFMKEVEGGDT